MSTKLSAQRVSDLLARYGIHTPINDDRYYSHEPYERGQRMGIEARISDDGPRIVLRASHAEVYRLLPLGTFMAHGMVQELSQTGALPLAEQAQNMVAHLIVRCAKLFLDMRLSSLSIAPIYVTADDYRVGYAEVSCQHHIRVARRLTRHAHDRSALSRSGIGRRLRS